MNNSTYKVHYYIGLSVGWFIKNLFILKVETITKISKNGNLSSTFILENSF